MKRILLVLGFIFCACSIMANPLGEFYPEKATGFAFLEKDFFKEFMGLDNGSDAVAYLNEVNEKTKEMMGLDLEEQVEHIGLFVVPDEFKQSQRFYFLEGKFNFSPIKSCLDGKTDKKGNKIIYFHDIEFSGFKVKFLHTGSANLVYINDNILLLCSDIPFDMLKRDSIVFGKAPEVVSEIFEKRSNFISVDKKALEALSNVEEFKGKFDFSLIKLASVYFKNQEFVFELTGENEADAEKLLPLVDSMLKEYKDKTEQEYNKIVKAMDDSASALNPKNFNSIYYFASIIDFIKALKVSSNENAVDIVFTGDRVTLCNILYYVYQNNLLPVINRMKENEERELCFYKQRALVSAIERYNDNVSPSMASLDFLGLSTSEYLNFPDSFLRNGGCDYRNVGSLNKGGYIYCAKHGRVEPLIRPRISNKLKDEEDRYRCIKNMIWLVETIDDYNCGFLRVRPIRKPGAPKEELKKITTELDFAALEKEGFFKKGRPVPPTPECEYYITGDMSAAYEDKKNAGTIACKKHGVYRNSDRYDRGYSEFIREEYKASQKQKNNSDEDEFEE